MSVSFESLRSSGRPILLDGATGTELERRGFPLEKAGWSARAIDDAADLLEAIHRDYAEAGAEIVTANTFRLHRRNLADWGAEEEQRRLVTRAVEIARRGSGERVVVAGSLAPIGDCYSPDEVPDTDRLADGHRELAVELTRAGVGLILVETMVSGVEAEAAARAAGSTGVPFVVSFVTGPGGRLLTGERLMDVLPSVLVHGPVGVGINCVSCRDVDEGLAAVVGVIGGEGARDVWPGASAHRSGGGCAEGQNREALAAVDRREGVAAGEGAGNVWPGASAHRSGGRKTAIAVYANTGERGDDGSWRVTEASEPAVYAGLAEGWLERGVGLIGGCCGTTPDHIRSLQGLISK